MSEVKPKCFRELSSTKMLSVKGPQRLPEHGREGAVCEVRGSREQESSRRKVQGTAWRTGGEDTEPSQGRLGQAEAQHTGSVPRSMARQGHGKGAGHGEGAPAPTGESWPRRSPGGPARRARSW